MFLRPRKSEVVDHRIRPSELASDSIATKPAAAAASACGLVASGKKSE